MQVRKFKRALQRSQRDTTQQSGERLGFNPPKSMSHETPHYYEAATRQPGDKFNCEHTVYGV